MRLNPKKKYTVVSRSRTIVPCHCDLTLGVTELAEVKVMRILGIILDCRLMCETHLREVVSKTGRNLGMVREAGNLFDCPRVLKSCLNAYVL